MKLSYRAFDIVTMACSLGGLKALRELLAALPATFPAAVVLVQHMRQTCNFVEVLQNLSPLPVRWAGEGEMLTPGGIFVAPPDRHLTIRPDGSLMLSASELVNYVRPAADPLFESAAAVFASRAIGVVLSGLGRDGAAGARAIKLMGGRVLAQDRQTAEKFDMPFAAIESCAVDFVLSPSQIAAALVALVTVPGAASLFSVAPPFTLAQMRHHRELQRTTPLRASGLPLSP